MDGSNNNFAGQVNGGFTQGVGGGDGGQNGGFMSPPAANGFDNSGNNMVIICSKFLSL